MWQGPRCEEKEPYLRGLVGDWAFPWWEDSIRKGEASKGSGAGGVARPRAVVALSARTPLVAVWGHWGWRSGEWRAAVWREGG